MSYKPEKFDAPNNEFFESGLEDSNLQHRISKEDVLKWFDEMPDEDQLEEVYWIEPPFSFASISTDNGQKVYEVHEVAEQESDVKDFVIDSVGYNLSEVNVDYPALFDACENLLDMIKSKQLVDRNYADMYCARKDSSGYMRLYPYVQDVRIEDISYNGSNPVFIFHTDYRSIQSNLHISQKEADAFLVDLLDNFSDYDSNGVVDKKLTERVRIVATLSSEDNGLDNSVFTLKTDRPSTFTPVDLYEYGTYSSTAISYLWMAVDNDMSILFGGGTSSGKTSTLEAVLLFTKENQKIMSVEKSKEISIPHRNWTSQGSLNDENIDNDELLRSALRQRPKYVVLGEARGRETETLFQAMNTGYTAFSTMHAESVTSCIERLASPPVNIPKEMMMSLDIVCAQNRVQLSGEDGDPVTVRRAQEIREIVNLRDDGNFENRRPLQWESDTDEFVESLEDSHVVSQISELNQMSVEEVIEEISNRKHVIEGMSNADIDDAESVREVITSYEKDPKHVIEAAEKQELEKLISDNG